MNGFKHFLRLAEQKNPARRASPFPRARPGLETLEDRLAPASVFVVAPSAPADSTHYYSLRDAATAAGANGTVTIEPGASPGDAGAISITKPSLTIQGDPNVPGSILAEYSISVDASGVTLTNLRVALVTIDAGFQNTTISKSLVGSIVEMQSNIMASLSNVITQNYITGTVTLNGNIGGPAGDLITNNTFANRGISAFLLSLTQSSSTMVSANRFFGSEGGFGAAIDATDTGSPSGLTTIANNSINLSPVNGAIGIEISKSSNGTTAVSILNNTVDTNGQTGLLFAIAIAANFEAIVQGNDLHNNAVGVRIVGDGISTNYQNFDLGGGAQGSLGGNNFRSFTTTGTLTAAAITLTQTPAGATISARHNIFLASVTPNNVIDDGVHGSGSGTGTIDVSQALDANHSFVQSLFNKVLGRTGSMSELDPWVQLLNTQGQASVVAGISRSSEALGRIVDQLYLRFLGRRSDPMGRSSWIGFLQNGGALENLETAFLTAPEYINHINTDFVQSLYINVFGRTGSGAELAQWNSNIQTLGLTGIANSFTHSVENRLDTLRTYFQMFLDRTPSDAELAPLVNSSADLLTLEGSVLSSPEYFTNG
jgi:hypothetical protein